MPGRVGEQVSGIPFQQMHAFSSQARPLSAQKLRLAGHTLVGEGQAGRRGGRTHRHLPLGDPVALPLPGWAMSA